MKKKISYLRLSLLFIGILAVSISACKKDEEKEENITPTPVVANKLSANFDGVVFNAASVVRQTAGTNISIMGKTEPQTLFVMFPDTCKVKSYPLFGPFPSCNLTYYPTVDPMVVYVSTSGTITFTEFSATGKIKATFNGVITKQQTGKATTINVTNGVMELN